MFTLVIAYYLIVSSLRKKTTHIFSVIGLLAGSFALLYALSFVENRQNTNTEVWLALQETLVLIICGLFLFLFSNRISGEHFKWNNIPVILAAIFAVILVVFERIHDADLFNFFSFHEETCICRELVNGLLFLPVDVTVITALFRIKTIHKFLDTGKHDPL